MPRPIREDVRMLICRMFFRDHASIEQIAERLGCQVQTVRRVLVIDGGVKPQQPAAPGPYHKEDPRDRQPT